MKALILSTSDNDHAVEIENGLVSNKVKICKLEADKLLNSNSMLTLRYPKQRITIAGDELDPKDIACVFIHHPQFNPPTSYGIDETDRSLFVSGWRNALDWLEHNLAHAVWVNRPSCARAASSIALQLSVAERYGLRVPATCFTNRWTDVAHFFSEHDRIIVKTGPITSTTKLAHRVLAHVVKLDDIDSEELYLSPCLFQQYLEKDYELRVHVTQDVVLACKIESQKSEISKHDWRNYDIRNTPYYETTLESSLTNKCRAIIEELGLTFGIIDLVVSPTNDIFFLECNAFGHWLWVERLTGLQITQQVINALLH